MSAPRVVSTPDRRQSGCTEAKLVTVDDVRIRHHHKVFGVAAPVLRRRGHRIGEEVLNERGAHGARVPQRRYLQSWDG